MHTNTTHWIWAPRFVIAVILGQTLWFKFTGAPESVFIFTKLGAEPWGRFGSGVMEALAVALVLWPALSVLGALFTAGAMLGAIGAHVFVLGLEVQGDGGLLFGMALTALLGSAAVLWLDRAQLRALARRLGLG